MRNKKGFEMTISTLILIVLGVIVLIAIAIALTGGFARFKTSTDPFLDSADGTTIKLTCQDACSTENKLIYCCQDYEFNDEKITCQDSRLDLDCSLTCEPGFCDPSPETISAAECEAQGGQVIGDPGDGSVSAGKNCPDGKAYVANVPLGIEGSICCK